MVITIAINGRTVDIARRMITYADIERVTMIKSPRVTYRYAKTGADGELLDGDHIAVAPDLEIVATTGKLPS